jgi:hypothetical protein
MPILFHRGQQIAYVPSHAQIPRENGFDWHTDHPDVEFGFVTSQRGDTVFCRYWRHQQLGSLRTRANSEGTPANYLVPYDSVPDSIVRDSLKRIDAEDRPIPA